MTEMVEGLTQTEEVILRFQKVLVTPEKAAKWLGDNHANRNISNGRVKYYAKLMDDGLWGECPQPIIRNGASLLDGQHRLHAVIVHGKPVWFWVCNGADDSIRKIVDAGRPRSTGDILRMEYGMAYASKKAAVAKLWIFLNEGKTRQLSHFEIADFIGKHENAFEWVVEATRMAGNARTGASPVIAPLAWLHKKYEQEVVNFHASVVTGEMLAKNSPALKLRTAVISNEKEAGGGYQRSLILTTLGAFANHLDGKSLKWLRPSADAYHRFRTALRLSRKGGKWADEFKRARKARRQGK